MSRQHIVAALAVVALALPSARAAPPPVGSEDEQIMRPYAAWVRDQHDRAGNWCCDIGDGRPVDARIAGDHWEAHVTPGHFPTQTDHWLAVPEGKIIAGNPTGAAILWLLQGNVQCFAPPSGV